MNAIKVKVTLIRSLHGRLKSHRACARGLGLRKIHNPVIVIDTPENRGMMNKISYMIKIEAVRHEIKYIKPQRG